MFTVRCIDTAQGRWMVPLMCVHDYQSIVKIDNAYLCGCLVEVHAVVESSSISMQSVGALELVTVESISI